MTLWQKSELTRPMAQTRQLRITIFIINFFKYFRHDKITSRN
jgi:hypothetical protein